MTPDVMSTLAVGAAWAMVLLVVGVSVTLVSFFYFRHAERIKDRDNEGRRLEKELREDRLENKVVIDELMELLQITDWRYSHLHDKCRRELVLQVKALFAAVGEDATYDRVEGRRRHFLVD